MVRGFWEGVSGERKSKRQRMPGGSHLTFHDIASEVTQHHLCHILFAEVVTSQPGFGDMGDRFQFLAERATFYKNTCEAGSTAVVAFGEQSAVPTDWRLLQGRMRLCRAAVQ